MPFNVHLSGPEDLVTPYQQTRAGFLKIALEKNRYATPYITEARALKAAVLRVNRPEDLYDIVQVRPALLAAAGLSEKSLKHMTDDFEQEAISNLIERFLKPAGERFVDELVFRFLLNRGDTLGGKMRNLAGKLAEQEFVRSIIGALAVQGQAFRWLDSATRQWNQGRVDDPNVEHQARGLYWRSEKGHRTLILNLGVPIVNKNIDLCLFDCSHHAFSGKQRQAIQNNPPMYIALGELKGGVDPAGADEHWKTANTALSRIRAAFAEENVRPKLFFVGAAIVPSMAREIYAQLHAGALANAANLTVEEQLFALIDWLIAL
jgi:hypothetical protein